MLILYPLLASNMVRAGACGKPPAGVLSSPSPLAGEGRGGGCPKLASSAPQIDDLRPVPAGLDETQQVPGRERRGPVVGQGVDIDRVMGEEPGIDHHPDLVVAV